MGLACDHLLSVEMVIPSGKHGAQVIQADEHDNADLLWASRGAFSLSSVPSGYNAADHAFLRMTEQVGR